MTVHRDMHPTHSGLCDADGCGCPGCDALSELERRHDILEWGGEGGYISINRPKNAPPLTESEEGAFLELAAAALKHIVTVEIHEKIAAHRRWAESVLREADASDRERGAARRVLSLADQLNPPAGVAELADAEAVS